MPSPIESLHHTRQRPKLFLQQEIKQLYSEIFSCHSEEKINEVKTLKFNQPQVLLRNVWKHYNISDHSLSLKWLTTILSNARGGGKCASNHYLPIYLTPLNTNCKELCNKFQLHFPGNKEGLLTVDKGCFHRPSFQEENRTLKHFHDDFTSQKQSWTEILCD